MSDFLGWHISEVGLEELTRKIKFITSEEALGAGVEAADEYLIQQLERYPQYKYVSIKQAGGWKSEKQRRYVMAAIREGKINVPYSRTQTLARGWQAVGTGHTQIVVNETPYAPYVQGDNSQSRMMEMRGWPTLQQTVDHFLTRIIDKFSSAYKNFLHSVGL